MDDRAIRVGHGIIVSGLAVLAAWSFLKLVWSFPDFVRSFQQLRPALKPGEGVAFSISANLIAWIPATACAVGIAMWRRWGQLLTIALCALVLVFQLQGLILFGRIYLAKWWILQSAVSALLITWLMLPPVRSRFRV